MTTLKAKFFFFFALVFALPTTLIYFCYTNVAQIHVNEQVTQELKEVEFFSEQKTAWSDADLIHAQYLRSRITYSELQDAFSLWIQSRSEGGNHLIGLRTEELQKLLHDKTKEITSQGNTLTYQLINLFMAIVGSLLIFAISGYLYMKQKIFTRVSDLTRELGGFHVSEYQARLVSIPEDEFGDLWLAFHAMVANLYKDLHQDLGVNPSGHEATEPSATPSLAAFKNEVQAFLVERRIQNDRRSEDRRKRA